MPRRVTASCQKRLSTVCASVTISPLSPLRMGVTLTQSRFSETLPGPMLRIRLARLTPYSANLGTSGPFSGTGEGLLPVLSLRLRLSKPAIRAQASDISRVSMKLARKNRSGPSQPLRRAMPREVETADATRKVSALLGGPLDSRAALWQAEGNASHGPRCRFCRGIGGAALAGGVRSQCVGRLPATCGVAPERVRPTARDHHPPSGRSAGETDDCCTGARSQHRRARASLACGRVVVFTRTDGCGAESCVRVAGVADARHPLLG